MQQTRKVISAASLVLFPLAIIVYWSLYPAYGILDGGAMLRAIDGHGSITTIADAFAFLTVFLSIPATLAIMRVAEGRAPKRALIGGGMSIVGWVAIAATLVSDVIAVQLVQHGGPTDAMIDLFKHIINSPIMIGINVLATLHVLGGIVLGLAFLRIDGVPRWAAVLATIAQPIHFGANLAGLFWVDQASWIALAIANGFVARIILGREP